MYLLFVFFLPLLCSFPSLSPLIHFPLLSFPFPSSFTDFALLLSLILSHLYSPPFSLPFPSFCLSSHLLLPLLLFHPLSSSFLSYTCRYNGVFIIKYYVSCVCINETAALQTLSLCSCRKQIESIQREFYTSLLLFYHVSISISLLQFTVNCIAPGITCQWNSTGGTDASFCWAFLVSMSRIFTYFLSVTTNYFYFGNVALFCWLVESSCTFVFCMSPHVCIKIVASCECVCISDTLVIGVKVVYFNRPTRVLTYRSRLVDVTVCPSLTPKHIMCLRSQ